MKTKSQNNKLSFINGTFSKPYQHPRQLQPTQPHTASLLRHLSQQADGLLDCHRHGHIAQRPEAHMRGLLRPHPPILLLPLVQIHLLLLQRVPPAILGPRASTRVSLNSPNRLRNHSQKKGLFGRQSLAQARRGPSPDSGPANVPFAQNVHQGLLMQRGSSSRGARSDVLRL